MTTLRTILKRSMICCLPWRIWKGEIDYLPISSKTLFSKTGIPIDILEQDLKDDKETDCRKYSAEMY